jgi:hypothetical protein
MFAALAAESRDSLQMIDSTIVKAHRAAAGTADKAYDSKTARQQIRDEGAVPVIPSCSTAVRKARWASTDSATRSKTSSVASGIGGDSPPPSTNSPAISSPPLASSRPLLGHVMSPDPRSTRGVYRVVEELPRVNGEVSRLLCYA